MSLYFCTSLAFCAQSSFSLLFLIFILLKVWMIFLCEIFISLTTCIYKLSVTKCSTVFKVAVPEGYMYTQKGGCSALRIDVIHWRGVPFVQRVIGKGGGGEGLRDILQLVSVCHHPLAITIKYNFLLPFLSESPRYSLS